MKRAQGTDRRQFVTAATAAVAATIVPRHVLGGSRFVPPSDRVNVAVIGVGGQGLHDTRGLLQEEDCQVVAIADPAEDWDLSRSYHGGRAGRGPARAEIEKAYAAQRPSYRCRVYEDFRVMLDKEKAIDAVLIATPDHLHAYVSIWAMRAGKHVYCEKPLTHSVAEARTVARVARETGVATQMGNQGRSGEGHRQTVEWIQDGAIGAVREVHAWSGTARLNRVDPRREEAQAPPPGLDWDLWLGPRAERPFRPAYAPGTWRDFWDFGGGAFPDMSVHHIDPAFNALGLDAPESVEATAASLDEEHTGRGVYAIYRFAAKGSRGPLVLYWYDGGLRPPTPPDIDPGDPKQRLGEGENGLLLVGEKGYLTCAGWSGMPRLLPLERHREYERPPKTLPRVEGHLADWLQACKGGTPACSSFDYGARLCELTLLGNVALRAGKRLQWDAVNARATNAPEADPFLGDTYRRGWELPA
jgi:predicted dehydrogenase